MEKTAKNNLGKLLFPTDNTGCWNLTDDASEQLAVCQFNDSKLCRIISEPFMCAIRITRTTNTWKTLEFVIVEHDCKIYRVLNRFTDTFKSRHEYNRYRY